MGVKPVSAAAARNGGERAAHATSADTSERVLKRVRKTRDGDGRQTARRTAWWCDGTDQHEATRRSDVGGRLLTTERDGGVAATLVVVGDTATTDGFSS